MFYSILILFIILVESHLSDFTLALIKPDAYERKKDILIDILSEGFQIIQLKELKASKV
jgi:nucleoside diphosphate kinase